ncbi:hypothetical protein V8D89_003792 [Ganoderma adspersum]
MTAITSSMQSLSLDEAPISIPPQDQQSQTPTKPRRSSRPDQVNPLPLPPMDEWAEVTAANGSMYFGFYADADMLQRVLSSFCPKLRPGRREFNDAFIYPALMYLRSHYGRSDIGLHVAAVPQRAKDLNPEIEEEVGENVLIIGLFALEEESYLNRMTQKEVDEIAELMGTKPTWWRITHLMPSI